VTDDGRPSPRLAALIAQVAPGTVLRRGLERMIRANTGGMIVLGDSPDLRALLSGGFRIDVLVTAQRLSELSKMDGAIVLDAEAATILWANVQLMPERAIPTAESGTRHRTAERVARQTGLTVIAVSKSMRVVTLYAGTERYVVPELTAVHARAEQALQAIERYRARFDQAVRTLNRLELTDKVTLRNVVQVLTSGELLTRLAAELGEHVAELGTEGRLLALQADQLLAGLDAERRLLVRDYVVGDPAGDGAGPDEAAVVDALAGLSPEELLEPGVVATIVDRRPGADDLDGPVAPRGYRLLSRLPRLSEPDIGALVNRFGTLAAVLAAGPSALHDMNGFDANQVEMLRDGLSRLAETDGTERYV
jgi:diadenylate cyclase